MALALLTRARAFVPRARQELRGLHWADGASLLALMLVAWVMLFTLPDYGLTYDENPHIRYGERVLDFYASAFQISKGTRSAYGAGFDLALALLRRISPWDAFRTNHFGCVVVALIGLLGTWKLGRFIAGPIGGLTSLAFLVLTPVYYGHQFNNPKDIPFAAGYIWGLYFIARLLAHASAPAPRAGEGPGAPARGLGLCYFIGLAVALGLGMSVRIAGAILIGYLALFLALVALERLWLSGRAALGELPRLALRAGASAFGAWLIMLAFWPRALRNPLEGPAAALETITKYTAYDSPTLLRGKLVSSHEVPWDYLPTYFAVQLPELTSVVFVAAVAALSVHTWRALRSRRAIDWVGWLLVASVLVPPLYAIVRHSNLYNGLRHFLFIIPPIAVLAGSCVARLARVTASHPRWSAVSFVAFALFAGDQLHALWRLHPHQHVFFNRASGGVAQAMGRYETEYYGNVYRELHQELVAEMWREHRGSYLNRTFKVVGCGSKLFFTLNLPLNFQYRSMSRARGSDIYATYARDGCLERYRRHPVITRIDRDGALLGVARDLRRTRPGARK